MQVTAQEDGETVSDILGFDISTSHVYRKLLPYSYYKKSYSILSLVVFSDLMNKEEQMGLFYRKGKGKGFFAFVCFRMSSS